MKSIPLILRDFIQSAIIVTFVSGLVYVTVQQSIRSEANDPQIQISEDLAASFSAGVSPQAIAGQIKIDMEKSLLPYAIVYDESGKPLVSTALLDNQIPVPPSGVFDHARNGENRLTWQPKPNVRSAIVVSHFAGQQSSGFVLAGRSLREVEKREEKTFFLTFFAWGAALLATLFGAFFSHYLFLFAEPR